MAARGIDVNGAGSPNSDGPGNAAWQRATQLLEDVQRRERGR